jgi:hypothetical protein
MKNRDLHLLKIRPKISNAQLHNTVRHDEAFQNDTLRPIIKLQNDLLVQIFINYIDKHKSVFFKLSPEKKIWYIENAILKDIKFRNGLKGVIIGQFTMAEYDKYKRNSSALNKRMMYLVSERLKSNLQLFEQPAPNCEPL